MNYVWILTLDWLDTADPPNVTSHHLIRVFASKNAFVRWWCDGAIEARLMITLTTALKDIGYEDTPFVASCRNDAGHEGELTVRRYEVDARED